MNPAVEASGRPLDLVVIGGGINGCAVAAEAARRGLRVALFEADDFGFGTTWRTTKLIHGGLRYLEHGDLRLVFESLSERSWLLRTRPYLVRPQRFVLPILPWTRRPAWQIRAGLALYDMLALYRGVPSHRHLNGSRLHELMPALADGTSGGFTFFDARVLSPERLALELALEARRLGALIANHTRVISILAREGRVEGVGVDGPGGPATFAAAAVVNAAGPWVDAVNRMAEMPAPELLGTTKGTHIVLELEEGSLRDAVFSTAKSDGRVFFAVPQGELLLVGTTDDRFEGDPGEVRPTAAEVRYLLDEAQTLLPGLGLRQEQIRYAFAGLRPLQRVRGGPEAAITRRHAVIDHGKQGGPRGLFSVVGGKLSTFRPLAEDVVRALGVPRGPAREEPATSGWRDALVASGLPKRVLRHLRIYGDAVTNVLAGGQDILCQHAGAVVGEISYTAASEKVATLSDILLRRTGIGWGACRGLCCHVEAAGIAGRILGWSPTEQRDQIEAFESDVARNLPAAGEFAEG
jgi:glycerol-3-phosphate dehydrogenase